MLIDTIIIITIPQGNQVLSWVVVVVRIGIAVVPLQEVPDNILIQKKKGENALLIVRSISRAQFFEQVLYQKGKTKKNKTKKKERNKKTEEGEVEKKIP